MNKRIATSRSIERRFDTVRTLVAVGIALLFALVVIILSSETPGDAINMFLFGPLTSFKRFANVIETMIPLLFTGIAVSIMHESGYFSMVMEGGFYFGGLMAGFVACTVALPAVAHPIVALLVAAAVGAIAAFIPAIMKYKWGANEVVSSIMLNYILFYGGTYILNYIIRDVESGSLNSYPYFETALLSNIVPTTRIHFGLIIAVVVVVFGYFYMYRSRWGYAIRMIGSNQNFAKYSGMAVGSIIIASQIIGGAIASLGGGVEQLGIYESFNWTILTERGFDGIIVAMLASRKPLMVPVSALFLAYVRTGADIMSRTTDVPFEVVSVIQAIMILFVGAKLFLEGFKHRSIVKNSRRELAVKEGE